MTKPLSIFLQLLGLLFLAIAWNKWPGADAIALFIVALLLVGIGGLGIRNRLDKE